MKKVESGNVHFRGILITAVAFIAMVLVLVFALSQVDKTSDGEQTRSLENAVLRATLTCYAVEGRYPTNVQYLQDNYGIVYNDDKYIVTIDAFASNLLPDIHVMSKGGGDHGE